MALSQSAITVASQMWGVLVMSGKVTVKSEFDQFLNEWLKRLKKPPRLENTEKLLQAKKLLMDLKRNDLLGFFALEVSGRKLIQAPNKTSNWQFYEMMSRCFDEIKRYERDASTSVLKRHFTRVKKFLDIIHSRLKSHEKQQIPEIRALLKPLALKIVEVRSSVSREQQREYHKFGIWNRLWEWESPKLVSKRSELNTRLEHELGKAFGYYLGPRGLKIASVARLVVLTCVAAGVGQQRDNDLIYVFDQSLLTVPKVGALLRERQLGQEPWFKK
jgi:hypothetical protein